MTHNYTLKTIETYENINSAFMSKTENYEIDSIIFQDFLFELIDIVKVNIILLAPFIMPLFIGYIIGKIQLNSNQHYEDLNNKIKDIDYKLSKCKDLINENFIKELDNIDFIINNNYIKLNDQISDISYEIETMKVNINIMNELISSEINNNSIFKKHIREKITNMTVQVTQLDERISCMETKER